MNIAEVRAALNVLTGLVEGAAESVIDATRQSKDSDADYEFIGFAARKNALAMKQPTDEEEAFKLLDMMQASLAQRMMGAPCRLVWKLRPELIISTEGMRIGCRLKLTPAIAKPRLVVNGG